GGTHAAVLTACPGADRPPPRALVSTPAVWSRRSAGAPPLMFDDRRPPPTSAGDDSGRAGYVTARARGSAVPHVSSAPSNGHRRPPVFVCPRASLRVCPVAFFTATR